MKKIYFLFLIALLTSCHQAEKKRATEDMTANLIEKYGTPVEVDTLGNDVLWYKFELDPFVANTEAVKGAIDKSLQMLPTSINGLDHSYVSYTWETPDYKVLFENDFKGKVTLDDLKNKSSDARIIVKLWITNK